MQGENLASLEFPGLTEIHAVDAAGVHPLLIANGKERYMPFRDPRPEEILTIANHILGSGQTSLAKYLIIAADEDDPKLDTHDIASFFNHILERIDWKRDLHFQTKTTIDTLDYSGEDWNGGSKVVMACRGKKLRTLSTDLESSFGNIIPSGFSFILPGILGYSFQAFTTYDQAKVEVQSLISSFETLDLSGFPLIILCDDATFTAETLNNFVWVTFTRSNPSHDIYGVGSFTNNKHWGCTGSLIIDARKKPHHAPELVADKNIEVNVAKWLKF